MPPEMNSLQHELLKDEYESCRTRYEDIYKAIWTQFNYFIIAVGGLIAFGKENFGMELLILIASVPLVFWFWATFEPLNGYADQAAERASAIELIFNRQLFNQEIADYETARKKSDNLEPPGMWHFTKFIARRLTAGLNGKSSKGSAWDSEELKKKSAGRLARGGALLLIAVMTTTHFRLTEFSHQYPAVKGYCLGLFNGMNTAVIVAASFLSVPASAFFFVKALFREELRSGVRTCVRIGAASMHLIAVSALSSYLTKIFYEVPTGSKQSQYEIIVTNRKDDIILTGPRQLIEKVKVNGRQNDDR